MHKVLISFFCDESLVKGFCLNEILVKMRPEVCSVIEGRSGKAGRVSEPEQTENILILTEPLTSVLGNVRKMS